MSVSKIDAVSFRSLTKVVGRGAPLIFTVELRIKLEPLTVTVKPTPPATTDAGRIELTAGKGFCTVTPTDVEGPPPGNGLNTKTTPVPPVAISALVMAAVSCVELRKI